MTRPQDKLIERVARCLAIVGWLHSRKDADIAQELALAFGRDPEALGGDVDFVKEWFDADSGRPNVLVEDGFVTLDQGTGRGSPSHVDVLPPGRLSPPELLRLFAHGSSLAKALPDEQGQHLRSALGKVFDAHAAGADRLAESSEAASAHVDDVLLRWRDAIAQDRQVLLVYGGRADPVPQTRTVDPHSVAAQSPRTYLWGHDHERGQEWAFRLDRVVVCKVLEQPRAVPPPDEPRRVPEYEPNEADIDVTLEVDREAWWLFDLLEPTDSPSVTDFEQGPVSIRFWTDAPEWFEDHILAAGGAARVVEPAAMAERIAERAQIALEAYESTESGSS